MKKLIAILLTLSYSFVFGQNEIPFFEQIAFDFYKDTIVKMHPSKKRIRIAKYAVDLHPTYYRFQVSKCLTGELLEENTNLQLLSSYVAKQTDFDFYNQLMNYSGIDKKRFRIKNAKTENYPYLRISRPYYKKKDARKYYVNIIEYHKEWSIEYFLLMDKDGSIINWCRDKNIIVTQYHG
jgi:hypothetical protein